MSEHTEALWDHPIPNGELKPELLPAPNAPWSELVYFAGTLDGYEALGVETEGLQAFADGIVRRYRSSGELPRNLTQLRAALFAEQRRDHWTGGWGDPGAKTMRYIHALVEAIRAAIEGSDGAGAVVAQAPPPSSAGAPVDAGEPLDLTLHGRIVHTVFDLLGVKEDDITYSVGWGLANSPALACALLGEVFADGLGHLTAIRLQQTEQDTGRTDIEVETDRVHLIVEAKRGWTVPGPEQLQKYADRLNARDDREGGILVVAGAAAHFPPVQALPGGVDGIPVSYLPWSGIAALVNQTADAVRAHAEKRLLRELHRYLRRLMTSQNVTSNLVYVVSLNRDQLDWSELTFIDTVMERDLYYHPVGGSGKRWPKAPANYLGFRFDGRLQRISHVESYEVITRPHDRIPEVKEWVDWTAEPHFLYRLGPPLPLPAHEVKSTKMWHRRAEVALDLLQTCDSIMEAHRLTRERMQAAGEGGT